jgi:hypothetical protein
LFVRLACGVSWLSLAINLPRQLGRLESNGINRQERHELVGKLASALGFRGGPGSIDSMNKFSDCDWGEAELEGAVRRDHPIEKAGDGLLRTLRRDDRAGIQHSSQEGGFHGLLWLAMISSMSLPKFSSSLT